MKKIFKILNLCFIWLVIGWMTSYSSYAQLSVDAATDPSSASACDGSIDITAAGSAGPFSLEIISANSGDTLSSMPDVTTSGIASGLCAGDYNVYAVNRFGCSHSLGTVTLTGGASIVSDDLAKSRGGSLKDLDNNDLVTESALIKVKAFPNPFANDVTIRIDASGKEDYDIQIFDVIGQMVYDQSISVKSGINHFLISDIKRSPSGVYLVHIVDTKSQLLESFKIFKTDAGGQDD